MIRPHCPYTQCAACCAGVAGAKQALHPVNTRSCLQCVCAGSSSQASNPSSSQFPASQGGGPNFAMRPPAVPPPSESQQGVGGAAYGQPPGPGTPATCVVVLAPGSLHWSDSKECSSPCPHVCCCCTMIPKAMFVLRLTITTVLLGSYEWNLQPCYCTCVLRLFGTANWQLLLRVAHECIACIVSMVAYCTCLWFAYHRLMVTRGSITKFALHAMMCFVSQIASIKSIIPTCVAVNCAGKFGQRTTSDIQRAYDAAPGPPAKGSVQEEGPPSAPPAPGPSSGLKSSLHHLAPRLLIAQTRQT